MSEIIFSKSEIRFFFSSSDFRNSLIRDSCFDIFSRVFVRDFMSSIIAFTFSSVSEKFPIRCSISLRSLVRVTKSSVNFFAYFFARI